MIQLRDYQIECIDILDNKGQGRYPASDKQKNLIKRKCRNEEIDFDSLTKLQASQILNRVMGG